MLFRAVVTARKVCCSHQFLRTVKRTFLSDRYRCEEAWKQRQNAPALQNIHPSPLAIRIQESMDLKQEIQPVDMDILANTLEKMERSHLDFAQHLFYRFRQTPGTLGTLKSTGHALIRTLLEFKEYGRVNAVLKDKLAYGVFLDQYLINVLLDHFIKEKMYQDAAAVAFDQMLQEDFSSPITRHLSWYACHLLWQNPPAPPEPEQESTAEAEAEDDDEEYQQILVNYIRPMWYDDHWDINRDSVRLGKTFTVLSQTEDSLLCRSYRLVGLALWEKFDKVLDLMKQWADSSETDIICQEAVEAVEKLLVELETKETPEPKELGLMRMDDVRPYTTSEQKEAYIAEFKNVKEKVSSKTTANFSMEEELVKRVKLVVAEFEAQDISRQQEVYDSWCKEREKVVENYINTTTMEKRKRELADRLLELQDKEEKLNFFDNLGAISVGISRVPKEKPIEEEEEEEVWVSAPTASGKRTK